MEHASPSLTAQRLIAHVAERMGRRVEQERARDTERLPFTIRCVSSEADLHKAVAVRHAAYARHVPEFAQTLRLPEAADYESDSVVLLAESKLDGSALGTMRIQINRHQALHLEQSVELPLWLQTRRLAEVTRLGISDGRVGRLVKMALMKALFEYCEAQGVDYMIATGRAPIDRQYEQLLFSDVFGAKAFIPLRHVGNLPHRIMAFEIATAQRRWEAVNHPMLAFFCHTRHPDIDISVKPALRSRPSGTPHALRPRSVSAFALAAA